MADHPNAPSRDYSKTLFLPKTDFPMRAGLPKKEPQILAFWERAALQDRILGKTTNPPQQKGATPSERPKFVLHDGPPYANGNLHIGHALNKVLKDIICRSKQMQGFHAPYVPGWDCHGLPIEWKIEEQYRAKGKDKDEVPINEFRKECRDFADYWIGEQSAEFLRLGVQGDFKNPYKTMDFHSEARIAGELMKFASTGQLYRGSKPVMWSVVERTALAEAEVEYHVYESDTVWVKFPIAKGPEALLGASVVIWTTTPWTMPGNRCVCYSDSVAYGLYEVLEAEQDFGPQPGEKYIFADALAEESAAKAKLRLSRLDSVSADDLKGIILHHPLRGLGVDGYQFLVPMLQGDHVTAEAGTGFVHTAPGHGRDDFENWVAKRREVAALGIDTAIPFTVDDAGFFTEDAPGFGPEAEGGAARIIDDKGKKGDANQRVITALIGQNNLFARGRLKHDYPHSWRSKKPVIFRNTPQWFVYMDEDIEGQAGDTLRSRALSAIDATRFYPQAGQKRLRAMIENRPDWVLSRQRAWGVPIAVFVDAEGNLLNDDAVNQRILDAFEAEGADAWFEAGAKERFLGNDHDPEKWQPVMDILDVWFDSGSTHSYVLEDRPELKWPADLYLEGSDQHRGWFHSSLLESCGTRGRAPYEAVLTHGFTMDQDGRKMSKSLGNTVVPQDIIKQYGADILRLWVASVDYSEDQRLGPEIIKTNVESYRKLRNTIRWMLGALSHFDPKTDRIEPSAMPELERYMLHQLRNLEQTVNDGYDAYDFKKVFSALSRFMNLDLSAFYFDVRKDTLYCDPISSLTRKAALTVIDQIFDNLVRWLAPIIPFTCEESWLYRQNRLDVLEDDQAEPGSDTAPPSVHLQDFKPLPQGWQDDELADKWRRIRAVRMVVTGALEIERREKRIGSSLEAAPRVYLDDEAYQGVAQQSDFADICITSGIDMKQGSGPADAFRLDEVPGVAVVFARAEGQKCARSWKFSTRIGEDADYPDVTPRDAQALRELADAGRLEQ
tara:strand:+ start:1337 stop:4360 length:3024 start_codon:yes stop_codon:yes gene_type:complete